MNTNKCTVELSQFRSYQTLVKQGNNRRWRTKAYNEYQRELQIGMRNLTPIPKETPIRATLTFKLRNGVDNIKYRVKLLETDNTVRSFDTLEEAEVYKNDRHYIEFPDYDVKYGAIADTDNLMKAINDTLEDFEIIDNDRHIVDVRVIKLFGNDKNILEIELQELDKSDIVINKGGK